MEYLLLLLGFVLLIKGADFFVDGSSSVAKLLKVPSIIIGLTVVAFGTRAPELSVSVTAALQGSNDLAVGNVLGSNIFNLLMVLGCCAIMSPVHTEESILKREFPFSILIAIVLLLLNSDFSLAKVLAGDERIPWHDSDVTTGCKYYSNADMAIITEKAMAYVTWHVTYFINLRLYILALETKEEVESIEYGTYIPEEYQDEVMRDLYALA